MTAIGAEAEKSSRPGITSPESTVASRSSRGGASARRSTNYRQSSRTCQVSERGGHGFQLQALWMPDGFETVVQARPRAANRAVIAVLSPNSHVGQPQREREPVRRRPGVLVDDFGGHHRWTRTDPSIWKLSTRRLLLRLLPCDLSPTAGTSNLVYPRRPRLGNQMTKLRRATRFLPPVLRRGASSKWAGQYPAPNQTQTDT